MVDPWTLRSAVMFWSISQMSLWKSSLQMRSLVIFWYQQISTEGHCAQLVVLWSLGGYGTGSTLASMGGLCLLSRDFTQAQQPLLLCFSFLSQLLQGFLSVPFSFIGLLCFGQESIWGFSPLKFSWDCHTLFCCWSSYGSPSFFIDMWVLSVAWSLLTGQMGKWLGP